MYHSDTPTRIVRAYDYAEDPELPANGRRFAQFPNATDQPDDGVCDSADNY